MVCLQLTAGGSRGKKPKWFTAGLTLIHSFAHINQDYAQFCIEKLLLCLTFNKSLHNYM